MENAGLITYRDTRLFVDEQSPLSVQKANLEVIAHETAHQWFGNIVTMAWWDDLWLNEAFATWMAARTVQRLRPDFDADLELVSGGQWAMTVDSLASARRIREPVKNRGDIDNAFDSLTYSKGAAVIGMFEHWIDRTHGAGTFLRGVTTYLKDQQRHDGGLPGRCLERGWRRRRTGVFVVARSDGCAPRARPLRRRQRCGALRRSPATQLAARQRRRHRSALHAADLRGFFKQRQEHATLRAHRRRRPDRPRHGDLPTGHSSKRRRRRLPPLRPRSPSDRGPGEDIGVDDGD